MANTVTEKVDNIFVSDGKSSGLVDQKPLSVHNKIRRQRASAARRKSRAKWTAEEDEILRKAVMKYTAKHWKKIALCLPGRKDVQCLHRWQKVLDPDLVKGSWTEEEDNLIIELVSKQGAKKWSELAKHLPGRMGKQLRERWLNHLNPDINKSPWTKEEERILVEAHAIHGNKWVDISKLLPGRTENSVKNHWNCTMKRKLHNFSTYGSANSIPGVTVPVSNCNELEPCLTPGDAKHTQSTKYSPGEKLDSEDNGELRFKDLVLGYPNGMANNPSQPHSFTFRHVEVLQGDLSITANHSATDQLRLLNDNTSGKNDSCPDTHFRKPSTPKTSSEYLQQRLNSRSDFSCNRENTCLSLTTEVSPVENLTNDRPARESYAGICYEPLQKEDLQFFLSTGRFPCTDSFLRQPRNSTLEFSLTRHTKAACDPYSSLESIIRGRAGSYDNVPTIIRKRGAQAVLDKVAGSLLSNQLSASRESIEDQKLEKVGAVKSVGRNLEKEFSGA